MTNLGKTATVAIVLLLAISIPASAGSGSNGGSTNWGAVAGAGILGGIVGGALAPAPQQQIIVVPAPPPPPANVIVVVPGSQPPQSANPINDRLLFLPAAVQANVIGNSVGQGCVGIQAFPMGVTTIPGPANGYAYWSLRCQGGRSFAVQIAPNAQANAVDCRTLKASGKECFKKF